MRLVKDIVLDVENAFLSIIKVIQEESRMDKVKYEANFEAVIANESAFKEELKECVICSYKGYEKFSKDVLSYVYDITISSIEEYCSPKETLPLRFKENMVVIEKAYEDGFNASK